MTLSDQAPLSSTRVRLKVLRELPEDRAWHVDRMNFTTSIRHLADGERRAVTVVTRPCAGWPEKSRDAFDRAVMKALNDLPGAAGSVTITMGRTYETEWDGVRAPI